jgi:hypothetical protein
VPGRRALAPRPLQPLEGSDDGGADRGVPQDALTRDEAHLVGGGQVVGIGHGQHHLDASDRDRQDAVVAAEVGGDGVEVRRRNHAAGQVDRRALARLRQHPGQRRLVGEAKFQRGGGHVAGAGHLGRAGRVLGAEGPVLDEHPGDIAHAARC